MVSPSKRPQYLVSNVLLSAKSRAEVASLGKLPEADVEVVERLTVLLYGTRRQNVCLSTDSLMWTFTYCWMAVTMSFTLPLAEVKVLDNSDCLARETQGEHLYLLFVEARETKVRHPIVTSKL